MAKENKNKRKLKTEPRLNIQLSEEQKKVKEDFYQYDVNFVLGDFGCLSKGTKVIMYDGSLKNVENVEVGDQLMGIDSKPRNVLSLCRGREQMYWVHQNRGISYRVNENHILSLRRVVPAKYSRKTLSNGKRKYQRDLPPLKEKQDTILNISLIDYINSGNGLKVQAQGYIPEHIDFQDKNLPINPYYLGLWLGDGSSNCNDITNVDSRIIEWLKLFAEETGLVMNKKQFKDRTPTYSFTDKKATWKNPNKLTKCFRSLNLYKNKHIPDIYKTSSYEQRMSLLAGIIDSDGHYDSSGKRYEIIQKNYTLSKDIEFLCRSLGFRTSFIEKESILKREGKEDYKSIVYRIGFSPDKFIPVLLERKKYRNNREICKNQRYTNIEIEKDVVDDYYGFNIDGDNLFLLEDFTVTHNSGKTAVCAAIAISSFRKKEFNKIIITRPIVKNSLGFLPGEMTAKMQPWVYPIIHNFNMCQSSNTTEKMLKDGQIEILPIDFAKGVTYVDAVVIIDEFTDMDYTDFRTMLTRLGRGSKVFFCGSEEQIDKSINGRSCIKEVLKLKDSGLVGFNTLKDNHRNPVLTEIINKLEK